MAIRVRSTEFTGIDVRREFDELYDRLIMTKIRERFTVQRQKVADDPEALQSIDSAESYHDKIEREDAFRRYLAWSFDRGEKLGETANRLERTVHAVALQLSTMGLIETSKLEQVRDTGVRASLGCRDRGRSVTLMKRPAPPNTTPKPFVCFDFANPPPPEYTVPERLPEWLGFPEQQPKAEDKIAKTPRLSALEAFNLATAAPCSKINS